MLLCASELGGDGLTAALLGYRLHGQHNGLRPAIVTKIEKLSHVEEEVKAKHWLTCCIINRFKSAKKPLIETSHGS